MADYILTSDEMTVVDTIASQPAKWATSYRNWCPIRQVPAAPYTKYYVYTDAHAPALSKDGKSRARLAIAKTESQANMQYIAYDIDIPFLQMENARRNGVPLLEDTLIAGLRNLDEMIAELIYQGESTRDNAVAVSGLLDLGTEIAATAKWDTAPAPLTHLKAGVSQIETNGFAGPFTWILSRNLKPGLDALHDASSDLSHKEIAKKSHDVGSVYFELNGDSTKQTTYPLPSAVADGVWLLVDAKVENFRLVEAIAPRVRMEEKMDQRSNSWKGIIDCLVSFQMPHTGSCVMETNVDLV